MCIVSGKLIDDASLEEYAKTYGMTNPMYIENDSPLVERMREVFESCAAEIAPMLEAQTLVAVQAFMLGIGYVVLGSEEDETGIEVFPIETLKA